MTQANHSWGKNNSAGVGIVRTPRLPEGIKARLKKVGDKFVRLQEEKLNPHFEQVKRKQVLAY